MNTAVNKSVSRFVKQADGINVKDWTSDWSKPIAGPPKPPGKPGFWSRLADFSPRKAGQALGGAGTALKTFGKAHPILGGIGATVAGLGALGGTAYGGKKLYDYYNPSLQTQFDEALTSRATANQQLRDFNQRYRGEVGQLGQMMRGLQDNYGGLSSGGQAPNSGQIMQGVPNWLLLAALGMGGYGMMKNMF